MRVPAESLRNRLTAAEMYDETINSFNGLKDTPHDGIWIDDVLTRALRETVQGGH